jgi:hypothetical protein
VSGSASERSAVSAIAAEYNAKVIDEFRGNEVV